MFFSQTLVKLIKMKAIPSTFTFKIILLNQNAMFQTKTNPSISDTIAPIALVPGSISRLPARRVDLRKILGGSKQRLSQDFAKKNL